MDKPPAVAETVRIVAFDVKTLLGIILENGYRVIAAFVELLVEGRNNAVSILQYDSQKGFHVEGYDANRFRDRWGLIHARYMHSALYDPKLMKPSRLGIDYLLPIFTDAIGNDDAEHMRQTLFDPGNLAQPYHSINTDVHKRIRYLETEDFDSPDFRERGP